MHDPDGTPADGELAGELIGGLIQDVPDFPKPGVVFKDVTPLLADPRGFTAAIAALADAGQQLAGDRQVTKVAGIEARGFIFAAGVALRLGVGLVPVRKHGRLPGPTLTQTYELEYGSATIEVQRDAFAPGDRVLIVDDVLATGGTIAACRSLVARAGAQLAGTAVLLELSFLPGRTLLGDDGLVAVLTV